MGNINRIPPVSPLGETPAIQNEQELSKLLITNIQKFKECIHKVSDNPLLATDPQHLITISTLAINLDELSSKCKNL